jgi:hypothetical protein
MDGLFLDSDDLFQVYDKMRIISSIEYVKCQHSVLTFATAGSQSTGTFQIRPCLVHVQIVLLVVDLVIVALDE